MENSSQVDGPFIKGDRKVGNTLAGTYRKRESNLTLPVA